MSVMKENGRLKQNLRTTFSTSKYMLGYVWRSRSGKGYILMKSFLSVLGAVLPLGLVLLPGLIINELTGAQRVGVLLWYIAATAGIPLLQSAVTSSLNVYLNSLRYRFMVQVNADFIGHCADMDYETMENPEIGMLKERAADTTFRSLDVFEGLSGLVTALVSLIMCISTITVLNPWILIPVAAAVVLNYINGKRLNRKTFEMNRNIQRYNRYGWPVMSYFSDMKYAKEISADVLEVFDYAALGHIHKPMKVGSEYYCYCGTPLACSVSEAGQKKGIVMVTMKEKGNISTEVLPLPPLRQVRVIKGEFQEVLSQACEDYVTVVLTDKEDLDVIDLKDRLRNAFPYLLEIRRERERRAEYKRQSRKIEELDPFELCCSFLGEHMDEEEREMLLDVISSVQGVK